MPMVHLSTIQLRFKVEQKVSITRVQKRGWAHGLHRKVNFTQEL